MKTKLTLKPILTLSVLVAVLVGFAAWNMNRVRATVAIDGKVRFGVVTILPVTQNARLNFVLIEPEGGDREPDIQPCILEVRVFDAAGRAFGTPDTFELRPGAVVSRNIDPEDATRIEGAFRFRATYKVIDDPNLRNRCKVLPTMEIFDRNTGGTLFINPGFQVSVEPDDSGSN